MYNNPLKYVDPTGHETCYDTGKEIGSQISQADCWAYGRDRWQRGIEDAAITQNEDGSYSYSTPLNSLILELSPEAAQQLMADIDSVLTVMDLFTVAGFAYAGKTAVEQLAIAAGKTLPKVLSIEFVAVTLGLTVAEAATVVTIVSLAVGAQAHVTANDLQTLQKNLYEVQAATYGGVVADVNYVAYHEIYVWSPKPDKETGLNATMRVDIAPTWLPAASSQVPSFLFIWANVWRRDLLPTTR